MRRSRFHNKSNKNSNKNNPRNHLGYNVSRSWLFLGFVVWWTASSCSTNVQVWAAGVEAPLLTPTCIASVGDDSSSSSAYVLQLRPDLTWTWSWSTTNDDDYSNSIMHNTLQYQGEAWVALGFSQDEHPTMLQSQALVGQPALSPLPMLFDLGNHTVQAPTASTSTAARAILAAAVKQQDGVTTMKFQYNPSADTDQPPLIVTTTTATTAPTTATILYSIGHDNELAYHQHRAAFRVVLRRGPCSSATTTATIGNSPDTTPTTGSVESAPSTANYDTTTTPADTTTTANPTRYDNNKNNNNTVKLMAIHGCLAMIAVALCLPIAYTASWFRTIVWPNSWIYIHVGAIATAYLLFLMALFAAMVNLVLFRSSSTSFKHSSDAFGHFVGGILLVSIMTWQVYKGLYRPAAVHSTHKQIVSQLEQQDPSLSVEEVLYNLEPRTTTTTPPTNSRVPQQGSTTTAGVFGANSLLGACCRSVWTCARPPTLSSSSSSLWWWSAAAAKTASLSNSSNSNTVSVAQYRRALWHWMHRWTAWILLGLSLYQVHTGLTLFATNYQGDNNDNNNSNHASKNMIRNLFWMYMTMLALALLAFKYTLWREGQRKLLRVRQQQQPQHHEDEEESPWQAALEASSAHEQQASMSTNLYEEYLHGTLASNSPRNFYKKNQRRMMRQSGNNSNEMILSPPLIANQDPDDDGHQQSSSSNTILRNGSPFSIDDDDDDDDDDSSGTSSSGSGSIREGHPRQFRSQSSNMT